MPPKIFPCKNCGQDVKWNKEFFDNPHKGDKEYEQPKPTLDLDGSEHVCEKTMRKKTIRLIPGTEYVDFYDLDLAFGNRINGFLLHGGYSLCKHENQKEIPFNITTYKDSLKFKLQFIKPPFRIQIKSKNFIKDYALGEAIKINVKFRKTDQVSLSKTITKITLSEFIGFYFCKGEINKFKIIDIETNDPIDFQRVVILLLRKKGIDLIGYEKQLIFFDEKARIFKKPN